MQEEPNVPEINYGQEDQWEAENRCGACGHGMIDRSENTDSVLCSACRERFIRYPVPKLFIVFQLLLLFCWDSLLSDFPKL
ncbi:hypothetical protein [Lacrimispora xylanisolvens]|uniref:hypothetical protein n=1 Tax=Lacrimispora xylanisolvens TaxID=384636 RepID=UPI002402C541